MTQQHPAVMMASHQQTVPATLCLHGCSYSSHLWTSTFVTAQQTSSQAAMPLYKGQAQCIKCRCLTLYVWSKLSQDPHQCSASFWVPYVGRSDVPHAEHLSQ